MFVLIANLDVSSVPQTQHVLYVLGIDKEQIVSAQHNI